MLVDGIIYACGKYTDSLTGLKRDEEVAEPTPIDTEYT